jgi:hypothetical protein
MEMAHAKTYGRVPIMEMAHAKTYGRVPIMEITYVISIKRKIDPVLTEVMTVKLFIPRAVQFCDNGRLRVKPAMTADACCDFGVVLSSLRA